MYVDHSVVIDAERISHEGVNADLQGPVEVPFERRAEIEAQIDGQIATLQARNALVIQLSLEFEPFHHLHHRFLKATCDPGQHAMSIHRRVLLVDTRR